MATVFAAIGAGVSSAASAVGGLFGTGASAASATGAAGATTTTLSQVLSAGSALAAIGQGFAAKSNADTQAAFAETEAAQEKAAGAGRARDLAREHAELRSEQSVIQLANGLDIGVGTPVNVADATKRQAERNLSVTRENTRNRSRMARLRGRGLMSEGRSSLLGGFGKAAGIGLEAAQLTG